MSNMNNKGIAFDFASYGRAHAPAMYGEFYIS